MGISQGIPNNTKLFCIVYCDLSTDSSMLPLISYLYLDNKHNWPHNGQKIQDHGFPRGKLFCYQFCGGWPRKYIDNVKDYSQNTLVEKNILGEIIIWKGGIDYGGGVTILQPLSFLKIGLLLKKILHTSLNSSVLNCYDHNNLVRIT